MITLKVHGYYGQYQAGYIKFKGHLSQSTYQKVMKRLHIVPADHLVIAKGEPLERLVVYNQQGAPVAVLRQED